MEFKCTKLGNVLENIHSGGTPSTKMDEYWNGEIKWLSSGETSNRFISDTVNKITYDGVVNSSTKKAKKGNIVIACAGQGKTRGQTSFLLDDMYINQSIIALEPNSLVLPLYLFYDLQSRYEELRGESDSNSIRGSITTTSLRKISFKYPSIEIQTKIVNYLYPIDVLIENNNKRIKILEQMADELYKEWFVRFRYPGYEYDSFVGDIPAKWKISRIKELGKIITGKTPSTKNESFYGDYCMFVKTPDMHGNTFVISTAENLSEEGSYSQKKCLLETNSIMVSCIGTGGVVAINKGLAHTNQQINSIVLKNTNHLYWCYFTVKYLKEVILMYGNTGTTMTNLSKGKFEKIKILNPDDDLKCLFQTKVQPIMDEVYKLMKSNDILIKQRDLLLPRLMSGKLEIK